MRSTATGTSIFSGIGQRVLLFNTSRYLGPLLGDIPRSPAIPPSDKATSVLEGWLTKHDLASRLQSSDDLMTILDDEGARIRVLSEVVRRQGQPEFHLDLVIAYNSRCAISGCDVRQVLKAAHIRPHTGPKPTPSPTDSRCDPIFPHSSTDIYSRSTRTYRVVLDRSLRKGFYKELQGARDCYSPLQRALVRPRNC